MKSSGRFSAGTREPSRDFEVTTAELDLLVALARPRRDRRTDDRRGLRRLDRRPRRARPCGRARRGVAARYRERRAGQRRRASAVPPTARGSFDARALLVTTSIRLADGRELLYYDEPGAPPRGARPEVCSRSAARPTSSSTSPHPSRRWRPGSTTSGMRARPQCCFQRPSA